MQLETRQLLSATVAPASGLTSVEPTADEQYMLQLINRARANPQAEGQRLLALAANDPVLRGVLSGWSSSAFLAEIDSFAASPPLAFDPRLTAAAVDHDAAMVATNSQVHSTPGSLARPASPDQLAPDGQPFYPSNNSSWATAENIFAYSANLPDSHGTALDNYFEEAFLLDWGNPEFGHLKNTLAPGPQEASPGVYPMSEIGIGIITDAAPTVPPPSQAALPGNQGLNVGPALVTEEFGWRSGTDFLTGATNNDSNADAFYEPGEGLSGVQIQAVGVHSEGTFGTATWGSGGYSLELPPGTYNVTASGGGLTAPRTATITIGGDNVGWDVIQSPRGTSAPVSTVSPNPSSGQTTASHASPSSNSSGAAIASPNDASEALAPAKRKHHVVKVHHPVKHPKPPKHPRHR